MKPPIKFVPIGHPENILEFVCRCFSSERRNQISASGRKGGSVVKFTNLNQEHGRIFWDSEENEHFTDQVVHAWREQIFKMKRASISARLTPDFDPKDTVLIAYPAKLTERFRADTKTHYTFIYDYLIITLDFLQSDQKELPFPNITRAEEEFLVKLNERKLNLSDLNEQCWKAVNKILEIVEKNKNVYQWTHIYKGNTLNKYLVYKKLAISQPKDVPCPTSTTMHTLASAFQDMCLQDRQEVKPSFKTAMLNTTLKFIKDPTQLTLEYPKMSLAEAQFLHNLIHSSNQNHSNLSFGFKSMYSSLHDAIEKLNENYALKFDFINTFKLLTNSQFMLKKIPKKQKIINGGEVNNNLSQDPKGVILSSNLSNLKPSTKPQQSTKEKIVKSLTETFIKGSLEKFLAFIEDDFMASLEFKEVTIMESRFLECAMSMCQSEQYAVFSPECEVLAKRIHRATRRAKFALQRNVGKLCRRTETRTIAFFKTPSYDTSIVKEAKNDVKNASIAQALGNEVKTNDENVKPIIKLKRSDVKDVKPVHSNINYAEPDVDHVKLERPNVKETKPDVNDVKSEHLTIQKAKPNDKNLKPVHENIKEARLIDKNVKPDPVNIKEVRLNDKNVKPDPQNMKEARLNDKNVIPDPENMKEARLNDKNVKPDLENIKEARLNDKNVKPDPENMKEARLNDKNEPDHENIKEGRPNDKDVKLERTIIKETSSCDEDVKRVHLNRSEPIKLSVDSDSTGVSAGASGRAPPPPASRRGRLLKALSTPLSGGLAERMMRNMGWEGGGLGSRGEGVLEPIMPAIHLKPGAGLGHVIQAPPTSLESRDKLLRDVLTFVQSPAEDTVIALPHAMTDKQTGFLRHAIEGFNDRRIIGISNKDETDLIRRIVEEIMKNPRLYIGYQMNDKKTKLRLVKVEGPTFVQKSSKKKAKPRKAVTSADIISVVETVDDIEELCPTRKAAQRLAYKLKFLEKIREFLVSKNTEAECKFDCVLNKKQKEYIQKTITDVNRGVSSATPNRSELENEIFREIKRTANAACGIYISITFNSQSFKLYKKTSPKNQTNCISSLPPPKSKDLKNTIVYLPKPHS